MTTQAPRPAPTGHAATRWFVLAPLLIFVVLSVAFAYALITGDPSRLPSALIGRNVPEFTLPPVEALTEKGGPVAGFSNADLGRGAVTIVNVWASWCIPCHEEHPLLTALKAQTKVALFGINYKDDPADARRFLGRYGNPFDKVGADRSGRTAIDWGVYGVPETYVVDGSGRIAYRHVGPLTESAIKTRLLPAVEAARAAKPR